jgi:hypothetical protein
VLCKIPSTTPVDEDGWDAIRNHYCKRPGAFPQHLEEGLRDWMIKSPSGRFYDEYAKYMSPLLTSYLLHLTGVKSYSKAEAAVETGGDIDHTAWSTTHQDVIQVAETKLYNLNALNLYVMERTPEYT